MDVESAIKAVKSWFRKNRRILALLSAACIAAVAVALFDGGKLFGRSWRERKTLSDACAKTAVEFSHYLKDSKHTLPVSSIPRLREVKPHYNARLDTCFALVSYDVEGGTVSELYDLSAKNIDESKKLALFCDYPNPLGTKTTWSFGNVLDNEIKTRAEFDNAIRTYMED